MEAGGAREAERRDPGLCSPPPGCPRSRDREEGRSRLAAAMQLGGRGHRGRLGEERRREEAKEGENTLVNYYFNYVYNRKGLEGKCKL